MNAEKFFKEMYFNIWQSHAINTIDDYYAKDFQETIQAVDDNKKPIALNLNYEDLVRQAKWQAENYTNTTLEIKKIAASDAHISVHFYSTSIVKATNELRHPCVCGIWHLNKDGKIDRVWAVVTPLYQE